MPGPTTRRTGATEELGTEGFTSNYAFKAGESTSGPSSTKLADGSLSNPSRNSFGRISDTDGNPAAQSEVFSADQGIELLKNEKRIQQLEKRKEILYYSGHQQTDNVR